MKKALVLGAGGFIGSHMVQRLVDEGYWVRGVDIKHTEFGTSAAHEFIQNDLRDRAFVDRAIVFRGQEAGFYDDLPTEQDEPFDQIYQFAADMGGAGYISTGNHDAEIMHNSALINLNILQAQKDLNGRLGKNTTRIFYSSTACVYPERNQMDPKAPDCREDSVYPAEPDSEYGWEKLFSERLYLNYQRNHGMPIAIARYHNIYGPQGTWDGGREKAPAAICRKVAMAEDGGEVECWGTGEQTRSFLFIDECIEATRRLMESDFGGPINIGSEEMVSINGLIEIVAKVAGKNINIRHIEGPLGVPGRTSNNDLLREKLGWDFSMTLEEGLAKSYQWIDQQVRERCQSSVSD